MSTNVPNLKQIGGGHRKNGQKFVDLMWNDPYMIFWQFPNNRTFHLEILDSTNMHQHLAVRHRIMVNCIFRFLFKNCTKFHIDLIQSKNRYDPENIYGIGVFS